MHLARELRPVWKLRTIQGRSAIILLLVGRLHAHVHACMHTTHKYSRLTHTCTPHTCAHGSHTCVHMYAHHTYTHKAYTHTKAHMLICLMHTHHTRTHEYICTHKCTCSCAHMYTHHTQTRVHGHISHMYTWLYTTHRRTYLCAHILHTRTHIAHVYTPRTHIRTIHTQTRVHSQRSVALLAGSQETLALTPTVGKGPAFEGKAACL